MFTRNFNRKNVKENNTNIFLLIKTLGYCRFIFSKYSKIQNKHDKRRNAHKGRQINTKGDKSTQRETNQYKGRQINIDSIQHWETEMQSESLQLIYTSVINHFRIYLKLLSRFF